MSVTVAKGFSFVPLAYPAILTLEKEGGYSVSFPEFPEAHTQGDSKSEAIAAAIDCLHTAIEWRLERKERIPEPSRKKRRHSVEIPVPFDLAPKLGLIQVMIRHHISNVGLARKIGVSEVVVRRMLDPRHTIKPSMYLRALMALGCVPQVSIRSADGRR